AGLAGLGALVAGLAPYLYLFAAPDHDVSWGTIDSAGALVHHVLRSDYGGPGAFSPRGGELDPLAHLAVFARDLARAWLWLPLAGGLVVLARNIARAAPNRETRVAWAMLAASFVL